MEAVTRTRQLDTETKFISWKKITQFIAKEMFLNLQRNM